MLSDQTGAVVRVTTIQHMEPPPPIERGMMTFGDRPNSVMAHWVGGACETSPSIAVTPDQGVTIRVTIETRAEPCDGVDIRRYVMIEFNAPLDMSRTSIAFEP